MLFGSSASAVGVIYNTTVVPELNADWSELADEQYKDMIAIPDPEKSGANKAALEAVTTGEKGILIAGVDYNAYSSMAKGEPLNIYYPASGTVVNPRPAMILKTAPNMDNAKAFHNHDRYRSASYGWTTLSARQSAADFAKSCGTYACTARFGVGVDAHLRR